MLRESLAGLTPSQIDAFPIPGTWSIRQIICHLADAEILFADRMKRIIAEDQPAMMRAEPIRYLTSLHVESRVIGDELELVASIRRHIARILAALSQEKFDRTGIHSTDGPMTLMTVLERATAHIPHHLQFVEAKKTRLLTESR